MRASVLIALLGVGLVAALSEQDYQNEFTSFVNAHGKKYEMADFFYRFSVFKDNLDLINSHNAKRASFSMGLNQFADLTAEEFKAYVQAIPAKRTEGVAQPYVAPKDFVAPANGFDWRDQGGVLDVKDQSQCGSCWAFSTTGPMETWLWLQNGKTGLTSLSEQQLVDCSKDVCYGCQGGWPYKATEYVMKRGICSEQDYRYTGRDGSCRDASCTPVIKPGQLTGYWNLSGEADFKSAVEKGTISVLVKADSSAFQFYRSGVLDNASCGTEINHAITLVGWNVDEASGKEYYIVKNSWGKSWGFKGYVHIVAGKNMCGINYGPVMPLPK